MLIMARDREYSDLLNAVKGKTVSIWTCNTCARLCYGLGGKDSAERLAGRLREDGTDVKEVGSTSAGCIESKLVKDVSFGCDSDMVISLTCDIGARCADSVFAREILNPVVTFGTGFMRADGEPVLLSCDGSGMSTERKLSDLAEITPETASFV